MVEPEIFAVTGPEDLDDRVVREVMALVVDLVAAGAALGWVDPPSTDEVRALLMGVAEEVETGEAALYLARVDGAVVGFGYWRRYLRPDLPPACRPGEGRGAGRPAPPRTRPSADRPR